MLLCGSRISSSGSWTISTQYCAVSCSVALYSLRNVIRTQRSPNPGRAIRPVGWGAEFLLPVGTGLAPVSAVGPGGLWGQLDFGSVGGCYVRAVS